MEPKNEGRKVSNKLTKAPLYSNDTEHQQGKRRKKSILESMTQLIENENSDEVELETISNILENSSNQMQIEATANDIQHIAQTIRNTLFEITEIKERNRERRHRELMQVLESCLKGEHDCKEDYKHKKQMSHTNSIEYHDDPIFNSNGTLRPDEDDNDFKNIILESFIGDGKDNDVLGIEDCVQKIDSAKGSSNSQSSTQKSKYQILRQEMLAMQRKKMEDRERKKRESHHQ